MRSPSLTRFLTAVLLFLPFDQVSLLAQEVEVIRAWSTVRKEQGLMHNYVASIAEAPDGSVWFATASGVSRFDGRIWTHFTLESGLPGFLVTDIHVDEQGTVWAASGEGYPTFTQPWMARFRDGTWESIELPGPRMLVRQLLETPEGILAPSRHGILEVGQRGQRMLTVEDGLRDNSVSCLLPLPDGSLVAFHGRGPRSRRNQEPREVSVRRPGSEAWVRHPLSDDLRDTYVRAAAVDPDGGLWFATDEEGILVYRDGSWSAHTLETGLPSNTITSLVITKAGEVWAGSSAGVGMLQDFRRGEWQRYNERDALPSDGVNAIRVLRDCSVWVGTRAGAIRYALTGWVHHAGPFANVRFGVSVELSLDGDLWASTDEGMWLFTKGAWQLSHKFARRMPVFALASGEDGSMWALTPRSLLRLRDRVWETVDLPRPTLDPRSRFFAIAPRRAGGCWIGGGNGVYLYDGEKIERLDIDPDGGVDALYEQSDGTLWIGGEYDLYRYRDEELVLVDQVETFGIGGPESIIETSNGDLWVAFLAGVWRLRGDTWKQLPEGRPTGFEGTTSMFESSRGTVWLASRIEGAIHTDGETSTRYGPRSGLPSSSVYDVTEDAEGNLWFATQSGLGCYRPDTSPPETELMDAPQKVAPLERVYLRLGGRDSWLGTPTEELQYSWRIDGGEWSPFTTETRVLLDRLPFGTHRFEARSLDRQFNVDPTPAAVTFEVLAPVFLRPWFIVLSALSLLAIVVSTGAAIQRSRRLKQAQQRLIDELEAELQEAHDMQMSLLPTKPIESGRVAASGRCVPANHVGGDYFSFDWMGDTFVFGAADVSGKAMKAAVRVMQLSGMFRYELRSDRSPADVLRGLHVSLLQHLDDSSFVTGCLGLLDTGTGTVRIANGGHTYPIHVKADGTMSEIEMPSMPLGMTLPRSVLHNIAETEVTLGSGDTLVFYSDGIPDLQNEAGEFYGEERLCDSVRRAAGKMPTEMIAAVMDDVGKWKGKAAQADDVTVVAVRYQGQGTNGK